MGLLSRPAVVVVAGVLVAATAGGSAKANMMDQMVMHYCSKDMQEEFTKAGKTAPAGMIEATCTCVVQRLKARDSIEQAKTFCKDQAIKQYGEI
jgi:hypothetical protein